MTAIICALISAAALSLLLKNTHVIPIICVAALTILYPLTVFPVLLGVALFIYYKYLHRK
jgi:hypothetical protein